MKKRKSISLSIIYKEGEKMKDYYEEYKRLEEEEETIYVDDEYSQNAPCDNSGMCAGSSCPYFWNCQN